MDFVVVVDDVASSFALVVDGRLMMMKKEKAAAAVDVDVDVDEEDPLVDKQARVEDSSCVVLS